MLVLSILSAQTALAARQGFRRPFDPRSYTGIPDRVPY
jgi:hypothetical protein